MAKRKNQTLETAIQAPPALKPAFFEQLTGIESEIAHHAEERRQLAQRVADLTEQARLAQTIGGDNRRNYWPAAVGRASFDEMDYSAWQRVFRLWEPRVSVWENGHEPRWRLTFEALVTDAFDPTRTADAMDALAETAAPGEATALRETARTLREGATVKESTCRSPPGRSR